MTTKTQQEAVDLLQELGLKEYEAKSFVVLVRMESATAKEIAEHSEVPRTRVYDAVRVLESRGLVEVQHTSPQQFRAVSIEEAITVIDKQYGTKMERLTSALEGLETIGEETGRESHDVWSLTGSDAIATRTGSLVDGAEEEVLLVVGSEQLLTDDLVEHLQAALDRDVAVVVGALTENLEAVIEDELPRAEVFVSGIEWLRGSTPANYEGDLAIGRLLLVDRKAILVSTFLEEGGHLNEQAVFGRGFTNGLVVIARRMVATGLADFEDPGTRSMAGVDYASDADTQAFGSSKSDDS